MGVCVGKGQKTKPKSEVVELVIPRGKQLGARISIHKKGDEDAQLEAGDIVVSGSKMNGRFKRVGRLHTHMHTHTHIHCDVVAYLCR
jgi:DnaJ-class molecular chaperone